jgi:hypothetical protein
LYAFPTQKGSVLNEKGPVLSEFNVVPADRLNTKRDTPNKQMYPTLAYGCLVLTKETPLSLSTKGRPYGLNLVTVS